MDTKLHKFNFRTKVLRDEQGNKIGEGKKQPSIEATLPIYTAEELVAILQGEDAKQIKLITDAVFGLLVDEARSQFEAVQEEFISDEQQLSVANLDFSKLNLAYIASLPESKRGAAAISEAEWEAFYADYFNTMVAATGKPETKVKTHVDLFKKPQRVKSNKQICQALVELLDIYLSTSQALDETGVAASRLRDKFSGWATAEDKAVSLDLL